MRTFTLKKLFLTAVFFLMGSLAIHATDDEGVITEQVTIKLDKAGTLPDKIGVNKKYKITNLKVIGDINGTDLGLIRDMAGCYYQRKETIGKLSILDLSETNIVNGGDDYYNDDFSKYSCENDKIGNSTFESCNSLTSINLPSSITEIGDYVFMNCNNLSSITIPKCVIKIGALAFYNCSSLSGITLPDEITSIGDACFYGCSSLYSIIIPNGITSLEASCFKGCSSLHYVALHDGITSLGDRCFSGCSELGINLPEGIVSIGDECFRSCSSLTNIAIPEGVTSLGDYCFYYCSSLKNITLPKRMTKLGNHCFEECSNLVSITLPDGLTSLGDYCFARCFLLRDISLPNEITSLGEYCFWNCKFLWRINLPAGITTLGRCCFFDCTALREIYADWITPIVIREDVFAQIFLSSRSLYLYVPKGAIDNYRRTDVWRDFYNIREYVPTDINNTINSYIKENSRFSLNGQRQNQPVKGLNIVKYSDGSVKKVIVK